MSEQRPHPSAARPAKSPTVSRHGVAGVSWGVILLGLIVLYAVLFVLLNAERVNVSFVFFSADASLVVVLALALGLGFVVGFFADIVRTRRRRRKAATAAPPAPPPAA